MEPQLAAVVRNVRQRRLALKKASKSLSRRKTENQGVLSDILCVFAKEMDEILDDIEALYKSSYVQTQDIGTLAQTILHLPELKKDKKLRQKIYTEFRKATHQRKLTTKDSAP